MKDDNQETKYYIGIIALVAILVGVLYIASTTGNVVETGDTVYVEYTGKFPDGTVFDTSDPDVAAASGLFEPDRLYQPLRLIVGEGNVIPGFENGILGMKEGEKKTLVIPHEEGYGPSDPEKINVLPLVSDIQATQSIPITVEVPAYQFEMTFGPDHGVGDTVQLPDSSVNMTIIDMDTDVNLSYEMEVGDRFGSGQLPWEEQVIDVNATHITLQHMVEVGDIIQFPDTPWNSTVLEVSETNITVQHNPIPDTTVYTTVQTLFGPQQVPIQVHFNETAVTLDSNFFLAGKTLVFDVEVVSIQKSDSTPATEP